MDDAAGVPRGFGQPGKICKPLGNYTVPCAALGAGLERCHAIPGQDREGMAG